MKTKNKIGIYIDCDGWGVYVFSIQLLKELNRISSYEIHVITHEGFSSCETAAIRELATFSDEIHFLPRSSNYIEVFKSIYAILMRVQLDLFIPNFRQPTYAAVAKLSFTNSLKVVGICHGNDSSSYGILSTYETLIDKFICASFVTENTLKTVIPYRKDDVHYIPHGIPLFDGHNSIYEGGLLKLVYIGRLVEDPKKISYIISLAVELEKREIPFHVAIVGDGPDADNYKNSVINLGLSSYVEFHGYKAWPDAMRIAQKSHVSILTSEHEGFCYGLAETMGIGLPAVVFSCGGVIEQYLKDGINGYVVPWGEVSMMADRLVELHRNPDIWRAFSIEARNEIKRNYSMESFGSNYAKLIDLILAQNGPRRSWPRIRPIIAERHKGTEIIEMLGKHLHLWQ
jgi:glycosyltransferase involved in cell wall biosynthesis